MKKHLMVASLRATGLSCLTLVWSRTGRTSCRLPAAASDLPGTFYLKGKRQHVDANMNSYINYEILLVDDRLTHPSFLLMQNRSCKLPNSVGSLSG